MRSESKPSMIVTTALVSALVLSVFGGMGVAYAPAGSSHQVLAANCLFGGLLMLVGVLAREWARAAQSVTAILVGVLGTMLVLGNAFLDAAIAWDAAEAWQSETMWLLMLALPAVAGLVYVLGTIDSRGEPEDGDAGEDNEEDNRREKTDRGRLFRLSPGAGAATPLATLVAYAWSGIRQGVGLFCLFVMMSVGALYGYYLNTAIFQGGDTSLAHWLSATWASMWRLALMASAAPVVMFFIQMIIGTVKALDQWRVLSRGPASEREFGERESDFVSDVISRLEDYLQERKYPYGYGFLYWGGFLVLFGLLGLPVFWHGFVRPIWEVLKDWHLHGQTVLFYYGSEPAFGMVTGIFAGLFAIWALYQASIFLAPSFAEYLHAREGWNSMSSKARTADDYLAFVIRQLRIGVWGVDRKPEPQEVIQAAFRQFERPIFLTTAVLCTVTTILLFFDLSSYAYFTQDRITYTDYWTTRQLTISYRDVLLVDLSCDVDSKDRLSVGYKVQFDKQHSQTIFDNDRLKDDLGGILKVDDKLRAAGVKFHWFHAAAITVQGAKSQCLDELKGRTTSMQLTSLRRLLHIDDPDN